MIEVVEAEERDLLLGRFRVGIFRPMLGFGELARLDIVLWVKMSPSGVLVIVPGEIRFEQDVSDYLHLQQCC